MTFRSVLTENQINENAKNKLTIRNNSISFKTGIYVVEKSFAIKLKTNTIKANKGDLLRIESHYFEKWDPINQKWKVWKTFWDYDFDDLKDIYTTIANNINWVASSENDKKVQELMTPSTIIFDTTKELMKYLQNLPNKTKIKIEIQ